MQPDSSQNPNPNPNHRTNQHQHHSVDFPHHCTSHPPFPHLHIPVFFCPHHNHYHLPLHVHQHNHLHLHAIQHPCNSSFQSSSSSSLPAPPSQSSTYQASHGPEINHAAFSGLEFQTQESGASNILEEEEEVEDVFVLTDEWAEYFAKSEARRQLAKKNKRKNKK